MTKKFINKYLENYIERPYYIIEEKIIKCGNNDDDIKEIIIKEKKIPLQIKDIESLIKIYEEINKTNKKVIRVK